MKCQKCHQDALLPFRCPYCGGYFCSEHRLPENHECQQIELARTPKPTQRQTQHEHTVTYLPTQTKKRRKINFSTREIQHLTIATLLVIGIGLSSGMFPVYPKIEGPLALALFTTILTASFLTHEIAHKIAAQRKELWAEFRLTIMGAILTLSSIVSPFFKIISPGAVIIAGFADRESIGKISIAGPATNIVLSTIILAIAFPIPQYDFTPMLLLGAAVNAWIALFNLIPIGVLDGLKVFLWNKKIWASAFTASLALTLISYKLIL